MTAFIYFLAVLLVSGVCYAACRLVGYRPKFKSVAGIVANVFYFAPLVAMSILLFAGLVAVVITVLALLLHTTGYLASVKEWGMWHLLPTWAWFAITVGASYSSFMAYEWRKVIAEWLARKQRKGSAL